MGKGNGFVGVGNGETMYVCLLALIFLRDCRLVQYLLFDGDI